MITLWILTSVKPIGLNHDEGFAQACEDENLKIRLCELFVNIVYYPISIRSIAENIEQK